MAERQRFERSVMGIMREWEEKLPRKISIMTDDNDRKLPPSLREEILKRLNDGGQSNASKSRTGIKAERVIRNRSGRVE